METSGEIVDGAERGTLARGGFTNCGYQGDDAQDEQAGGGVSSS